MFGFLKESSDEKVLTWSQLTTANTAKKSFGGTQATTDTDRNLSLSIVKILLIKTFIYMILVVLPMMLVNFFITGWPY